MKKGLLIIYSGPSAVGKDTILHELLKDSKLNLALSISMTTRSPREGEVDGKDYFFVSHERFKQAIDNDELLEYASYVDNYYGTPFEYVEKNRNEGKNVILEIEMDGAQKVRSMVKDNVISIYIVPPSIEELERRLKGRNLDKPEVIAKRLSKAKEELKKVDTYDYVVTNDELSKAIEEIRSIIRKEIDNI